MIPVITIDGPVASGKTSVSRDLAKELGWSWVSTGAFYRGLSYVANQENMDLTDQHGLAKLASSNIWSVQMQPDETKVFYRGNDVSHEIKKERVGATASQISVYPEVRSALLKAQRDCATDGQVAPVLGLVAEGRDCGSVVFPHAAAKFYLTARSESRAGRRALERNESIEKVEEQQATRDAADQQRAVAPLQVPEGANVVDTSELSLNEVVATILAMVPAALKGQA
jgi:cytidylate kinase